LNHNLYLLLLLSCRQGLADLTEGTLLSNASLAGIGNGSIAESIMRSAVPMTLAQDGESFLQTAYLVDMLCYDAAELSAAGFHVPVWGVCCW
jgi:hypothetical protein